jgi:hypothetical protein
MGRARVIGIKDDSRSKRRVEKERILVSTAKVKSKGLRELV